MTQSTGQRKRWPKDVDDNIEDLFRKGMGHQAIADELNVPLHKVRKVIRLRHLKYTPEQHSAIKKESRQKRLDWPEGLTDQILRLRDEGLTRPQIAERLGVPIAKVISDIQNNKDRNLTQEERSLRRRSIKWGTVLDHLRQYKLQLASCTPDAQAFISQTDLDLVCHCGTSFQRDVYTLLKSTNSSCGCVKSRPQAELAELIRSWGYDVKLNDRTQIAPYELDVWIPLKLTGIEFCGLYWHSDKSPSGAVDHARKLKSCQEKGIRLFTIFEDEWQQRREQVVSYLRSVLSNPSVRVGARELDVQEIDLKDAVDFVNEHHIQPLRRVPSGFAVALANDTGRPLAVAVLEKASSGWILSRYCVKGGVAIPGGLQKILAWASKERGVSELTTFADLRWSQGGLYRRAGFVFDGAIPPDYFYVKNAVRYHKFLFRRQAIESKLGPILPGESERAAMQRFGFFRVWDCGKQRWRWSAKKS